MGRPCDPAARSDPGQGAANAQAEHVMAARGMYVRTRRPRRWELQRPGRWVTERTGTRGPLTKIWEYFPPLLLQWKKSKPSGLAALMGARGPGRPKSWPDWRLAQLLSLVAMFMTGLFRPSW